MGIRADIDAIRDRFESSWQSLNPTIRYLLDNDVQLSPPIAPDETFVRFTVKPDSVGAASLGNLRVEQTGRAYAQICVPAATGMVPASELADDILAMFQFWRSTDGTVRVTGFSNTTRQPQADDPYFIVTVAIIYESNRPA